MKYIMAVICYIISIICYVNIDLIKNKNVLYGLAFFLIGNLYINKKDNINGDK